MKLSRQTVLACLVGMISGFIILVGITILTAGWHGSFFKLNRQLVEGLAFRHLVLLFVLGFTWSFVLERPYSRYAAASQVAWLPLVAICEMFSDPTSHNLWPFEFVIYAFLALIAVAGTRSAEFCKRRFLAD